MGGLLSRLWRGASGPRAAGGGRRAGLLAGLGIGAQAVAVRDQGVGCLFDLVRIHRLIGARLGLIEDCRIVGARRAGSDQRSDRGAERQARDDTRCHSSTVAQAYSPSCIHDPRLAAPPSQPAQSLPSPIRRNSISYEDRLRRHTRRQNSVVICRNKDRRRRAAGPKPLTEPPRTAHKDALRG